MLLFHCGETVAEFSLIYFYCYAHECSRSCLEVYIMKDQKGKEKMDLLFYWPMQA